jgi:hypothetical protein
VLYHEHISQFSVRPVVHAAGTHGLMVFDAQRIPTKGGSIRFWLQRSGGPRPVSPKVLELIQLEQEQGLYDLNVHRQLAERVLSIKDRLHRVIDGLRSQGKRIAAYGTSVGCAALIHQLELEKRLDVLFDDAPFKDRLTGQGYDLPVFTAEHVRRENPALIVVLAWRYADPIIAKHESYVAAGGRFVIPLPEVTLKP